LPEPRVTVVIPTLAADAALRECLEGLGRQSRRDFEVIVVDNSGTGLVRAACRLPEGVRVIENERNVGFGAAVNQAYRASRAPFLATLNDDAVPAPDWIAALLEAVEARPDAGMCASRVVLPDGRLDSAGMLLAGDGSSKQRGHGEPPEAYAAAEEVFFPSGSAALYRRAMLEEIGLFDEDFFLYCEDTDLGLRARWAGWKCLYAPRAVVEHRYSHSAGRSSPLKAFYVERNRLFVVWKNFPLRALWRVPLVAAARYFWHLALLARGRGAAAEFRREGHSVWRLVRIVFEAHGSLLEARRRLAIQRRVIRRKARVCPREFRRLMRLYAISPRQVAAL
jgi:GT2 family glycosyltransferase